MNKEKQHIQQLIDRYMAAETTQAEEALLADYFCTHHDVPAEWRTFSILFRGLRQGKAQEAPRRKPTLLRWSAAAVVVVAMGAGLLFLPSDHSDVAPTQPVAEAVQPAQQLVAPQSVAPQPERQAQPVRHEVEPDVQMAQAARPHPSKRRARKAPAPVEPSMPKEQHVHAAPADLQENINIDQELQTMEDNMVAMIDEFENM